jgi:hypothetical protein
VRSAEIAARHHRFTIIDGFSHALDQVYDRAHFDHDIVRREQGKDSPDYVENVFHPYKLYGSIDWRRINNEMVRSRDSKGDRSSFILAPASIRSPLRLHISTRSGHFKRRYANPIPPSLCRASVFMTIT